MKKNIEEELLFGDFITDFFVESYSYLVDSDGKEHKVEKYSQISFTFNVWKFLKKIGSILLKDKNNKKDVDFFICVSQNRINDINYIEGILQYLINQLILNDFEFEKVVFTLDEKWNNILFDENIPKEFLLLTDKNFNENINNLEKWKFNLKNGLIKLFSGKIIYVKDFSFFSDLSYFEWKQVFLPNLIYSYIKIYDVIEYLIKENFIRRRDWTENDGFPEEDIDKISINLDAIDKFWKETQNKSDKVFVGLPFDKKFNLVREKIKEVINFVGYKPQIMDEIEHNGLIDEKLIDEMKACKFGIFDITGRNPNVYFEVGFVQSMNKDVILLCRKKSKVEFDLAHINIIFYNDENDLKEKLERRIRVTNPPKYN